MKPLNKSPKAIAAAGIALVALPYAAEGIEHLLKKAYENTAAEDNFGAAKKGNSEKLINLGEFLGEAASRKEEIDRTDTKGTVKPQSLLDGNITGPSSAKLATRMMLQKMNLAIAEEVKEISIIALEKAQKMHSQRQGNNGGNSQAGENEK